MEPKGENICTLTGSHMPASNQESGYGLHKNSAVVPSTASWATKISNDFRNKFY